MNTYTIRQIAKHIGRSISRTHDIVKHLQEVPVKKKFQTHHYSETTFVKIHDYCKPKIVQPAIYVSEIVYHIYESKMNYTENL